MNYSYAQEGNGSGGEPPTDPTIAIIIAVIGLLGGFFGGFKTAKLQRIQLSSEAKEKFNNKAKASVENQNRWILKELNTHPDPAYWEEKDKKYKKELEEKLERAKYDNPMDVKFYEQEIYNVERVHHLPYTLGKVAKANAVADLKVELHSDEFTKTAKKILLANLDVMIEKAITELNKDMIERRRKFVTEITPMVVRGLLVHLPNLEEVKDKIHMIVSAAVSSMRKIANEEQLLISYELMEKSVKAELYKIFEERRTNFQSS